MKRLSLFGIADKSTLIGRQFNANDDVLVVIGERHVPILELESHEMVENSEPDESIVFKVTNLANNVCQLVFGQGLLTSNAHILTLGKGTLLLYCSTAQLKEFLL